MGPSWSSTVPTPHGAMSSKAYTACVDALQQEVQEALNEGFLPHGSPTHRVMKHENRKDHFGVKSVQHFMTQAMLKH